MRRTIQQHLPSRDVLTLLSGFEHNYVKMVKANQVEELSSADFARPGRPWAERAVWGALWVLSTGRSPDWLADHQPSRIRRRLHSLRPGGLLWAARTRAEVHSFRATDRPTEALRPHVLLSGAEAIGSATNPSRLEGYVTPAKFDWLKSDFPIVPVEDAGNVVLRVSKLARFIEGESMPVAFAAVDMADSDEPREVERGLLVLDDLLREFAGDLRDWLTAAEIAETISGEIESGDQIFALRILAKGLSDSRLLTEPADILRFLQTPPTTGDPRWDVLLASSVERECRLRGIESPTWTNVEGLEPWWFPALVDDSLVPLTIQRTPPELSRKGIWLDESALEAV